MSRENSGGKSRRIPLDKQKTGQNADHLQKFSRSFRNIQGFPKIHCVFDAKGVG